MAPTNPNGGGTTSDLSNSTVHDFIVNLESSAKKVLKAASKKHREALLKEQADAILQGRKAQQLRHEQTKDGKYLPKSGTVLMKGATMSSSMLDLMDPTGTIGKMPPGTETLEMRYSVPRMFMSMAADTVDLMESNESIASSAGSASGILSPIKRKSDGLTKQVAAATTMPPRRNLVLEKLATSPFLSQSTGSLDEILLERKMESQKLKEERAEERAGLATKEGTWALKSQVTEVMSGKHSGVGALHKTLLKKQKTKHLNNGRRSEAQGPVDWSCFGLKVKYRGETEREAAWNSWQAANAFSSQALDTQSIILSVAKMERHPLIVQFCHHVIHENSQSVSRTKSRLLMKRFVFDVHEVWLTNLQHLREHQPSRLLAEDPTSDSDIGTSGLRGRRDVKAIEAMEAQIQSVSQKRVMEKAFYTTRMPEPKVVLNYEPGPTPSLQPPRPLPPTMEALVTSMAIPIKIPAASSNQPSSSGTMYLFVDRLLPPSDHRLPQGHEVHGDTLWRLSTYRHENCDSKCIIVREAAVIAHGDMMARRYRTSDEAASLRVAYETAVGSDVLLPWSVMDIFSAMTVAVGSTAEVVGRPRVIRIEVRAALKADYEGDVLVLHTSPVELAYLLARPSAPLDDVAYWSDPARHVDTWPQFFAMIAIEEGHANEYGDPIPEALMLVLERTDADRVEGALSTARAHYYALELCGAVRIDDSLRLKLAGASNDIYIASAAPDSSITVEAVEGSDSITPPVPTGQSSGASDNVSDDETSMQHAREIESLYHNTLLRQGDWESAVDLRAPSSSMVCSGALAYVAQVPGSCEYGRKGLWFPHKMPREYTQVSATFFRDARLSSTDTVFVHLCFALDTSVQFPCVLAWEDFSTTPPKCPAEECEGYIPALVSPAGVLYLEPLISPIDARLSETAALFGTAPEEGVDHLPLDNPSKPKGMMRHWPYLDQKGFRRKTINTLLGVDPVLPTIVFGITKYGAQPNNTGVNTRNVWHSTLSITEHINRPRAPKDYHYIICNIITRGANDPSAFAVRMKAGECVGLSSSAFNSFEKEYAEIKLRREIFARQLALDAKIENSEMVMKTREKALRAAMQNELQRAIEKKLRKATKSEKGWSKRFHMSTVLEIQGNWERRRDERSGTIFFRRIPPNSVSRSSEQQPDEKFIHTCQWEVPPTWDGDPLAVPGDEYGDDGGFGGQADMQSLRSGSLGAASSVTLPLGGFEQPPETWHPALDVADSTGKQNANTSGIQPSLARRAVSLKSAHSDGNSARDSVLAERSFAVSEPATIDTANLEHIAEQLVSSDELMRIIARRLGLPETQVVPADEMQSVFSVSAASSGLGQKASKGQDGIVPPAPRDAWVDQGHEPEFDSDDDLWSDDEQEAGDYDADDIGDLPGDHQEVNILRKRKMKEGQAGDVSVPSQVPYLNLTGAGVVPHDDMTAVGAGWRRLPRPEVPQKFFYQCTETKTLGPDKECCNTTSAPIFLTPISPTDACQYVPENFTSTIESIFIPDCKKDMERAMATLERNIRREDDLAKNVPTDDLLLFGTAQESTQADTYIANQYKDDQQAFVDPMERGMKKALLAAKSSNIAQMEDALEDEVPINTADQFGNTLLILAAQQGSKRMCKFLLRRGANINMQSLGGNTCLHYCYAYAFPDLGEYLKEKGADDSILNVDGMTCYEGLNKEALGEAWEDDDEEEEEELY